ncbi:hypothetical protein [Rhizobium leguminosarum]|uniref:hypothetical protein n=1 Tax=Rhizobium leguminosarum TaxID=384 RepID=UPI001C919771|nr:hypothetical protein [Rhizobium leguminosarum]MBY3027320.1 hypothetical protein [Rhizobium leguminosarum]
MPLTDAEIEEKLKEDHGLLWKPDDSQRADIHSLDGFAINFMGHFKPLFTKVAAKRAPTIFTHMVLLEKDALNSFASKPGQRDYLVALNRGLTRKARDAFYSAQAKKLLADAFRRSIQLTQISCPFRLLF